MFKLIEIIKTLDAEGLLSNPDAVRAAAVLLDSNPSLFENNRVPVTTTEERIAAVVDETPRILHRQGTSHWFAIDGLDFQFRSFNNSKFKDELNIGGGFISDMFKKAANQPNKEAVKTHIKLKTRFKLKILNKVGASERGSLKTFFKPL